MEMLREESRLNAIILDGWRPYFWIILSVFLIYIRTIFFGFTYLDDKDLIVDNFGFISDLSNIPAAFMTRVFPKLLAPYYRPILVVSFMLNAAIAGVAPFLYHATNIILHAAVCCLVFRLLTRLGSGSLSSFFLSLVFAIHPVLAQAVAWIPGRNDSLLALFTLASFISFLNYLDKRRPSDYVLHLVFFILALFTKETAVMLVILCGLYAVVIAKGKASKSEQRAFVWAWACAIGGWALLRHIALRGSFESSADGLAGALWASAPAVVQYIGKIFIPCNLSVFPTIRDTAFLYGIVTIIALLVAFRRTAKARWPFVIFGLVWFFLFLAPSLVRPSSSFVHDFQEHRLYLPSIGIIIALSATTIFSALSWRRKEMIIGIVILAALTAVNIRHTGNFRDRLAFWENAVETSPHSPITRLNAASAFFDAGLLDRAEQEYTAVIAIDRVSSPAYAGLGHVYMARGRLKAAELQFKKAIAAYRANYPAYVSLGVVYYRQGRHAEAAAMWLEALRYDPGNKDALRNMAILCAEEKDYKAARFYVTRLRQAGAEPPPEFLKTIGVE